MLGGNISHNGAGNKMFLNEPHSNNTNKSLKSSNGQSEGLPQTNKHRAHIETFEPLTALGIAHDTEKKAI